MRYRGVLTGALLVAALVSGTPAAEARGCAGARVAPSASDAVTVSVVSAPSIMEYDV